MACAACRAALVEVKGNEEVIHLRLLEDASDVSENERPSAALCLREGEFARGFEALQVL
jgi:hypothetical protein